MSTTTQSDPTLTFQPLTPERWPDFEKLFGPKGACAGCWCMWWKITRSQFEKQKGEQNKQAMHRIVLGGEKPGLLAYHERTPIGWCAIAPRSCYPVLERSRILKKVDDQPVWSIVCFYITKEWRRKGVSVALIQAAVQFAREQGATLIEGYPVEPKKKDAPPIFIFNGTAKAFQRAGFKEVIRRSATRPIMRYPD